ncbi:MAG: hypothetical protein IJ507_10545 [Clostridia bacterium]|nr:hypothetical protein [Clostridia bacterium]
MTEILKMLNALTADELDSVIMRASIMLEKKRKEEAEQALLEKERLRQEQLAQERKRQEEIAELQRRLRELQSQPAVVPEEVKGDNFVMYEQPAKKPAPQPVPVQPQPVPVQPQPAPVQTQPAPQPAESVPQVRYADEDMKKWTMLPGEETICNRHDINLLEPVKSGRTVYAMEITNKRILLYQQSAFARNAGNAFGLAGALVRELTQSGPKPWLEVPLAAITDYGVQNRKEFYFKADGQTYVMRNRHYDEILTNIFKA